VLDSFESRQAQGFRELRHSVKKFLLDFFFFAGSNFHLALTNPVRQLEYPTTSLNRFL
jgi:hypothetical protein